MEQLRRLGPADEVRTLGMPPIYPADITFGSDCEPIRLNAQPVSMTHIYMRSEAMYCSDHLNSPFEISEIPKTLVLHTLCVH